MNSCRELKNENVEVLALAETLSEHLQQEIMGPHIIKQCEKLEPEKGETGGYYMLLMDYAQSSNRDFESYPRNVIGLVEDENH